MAVMIEEAIMVDMEVTFKGARVIPMIKNVLLL